MENNSLKITIDGISVCVKRGESISDVISRLGKPDISESDLGKIPLAADMEGKTATLNSKIESECDIRLLYLKDERGRRAYERSLKLVLICAVKALFPDAVIIERYSLGKGIYITVDKSGKQGKEEALTRSDVGMVLEKCRDIAKENLSFNQETLSLQEALHLFQSLGQEDKCEFIKRCDFSSLEVCSIEGFPICDSLCDPLLPSTGYLKVFDLEYIDGAVIMLLPSSENANEPAHYEYPEKLSAVFKKTDEWMWLMDCANVADLNRHIESGNLRELISLNEILHERMYATTADEILSRKAKAVLVAGPSSSGKTTSAKRIYLQLRAFGQNPIVLSLDNYYFNRGEKMPKRDGKEDYEDIAALDLGRFTHDIESIIDGRTTEVPIFNFKTGKREEHGLIIEPKAKSTVIIEGIHGLNPLMFADSIDESSIYKVYVSALMTLNLDCFNRIRTSDVRLIRRLVRDYRTRGASMEQTLSMWKSVRDGEEKWIFPYQEHADVILNTTLVYELAIMKRYVYNLLKAVPKESECYIEAQELIVFLDCFRALGGDVESEIPPTSIMREFIGGSTFK